MIAPLSIGGYYVGVLIEAIKSLVLVFLSTVQFAMLLRAILSWFVMGGGKFINFLYAITEPFIAPVRALFEKMNWLQNSPIDFSFTLTFVALMIIQILLETLVI